ncbi:BFD domain protein (2Fe-2S)-binding domain protein [Ammonifex degensii KC4]|uniref:BFD domain protein (2Fe-2S)-binding domain protein n=1 Tax=Ammonifex degensii (strain DSM 10501 / KC4) TaxID=429009 RepID=C9R9N9_AMMDK|nr:copper chaperone Copz family protein [Ammonifex degensii]ACX53018.1 BFD domain protein (2Fe-2S)-binding domain protein [Ammonifex degensii KC4]
MKCPGCGSEGIKVFPETVFNLLKDEAKKDFYENLYFACTNPSCDVAYFGEDIYKVGSIKTAIWYKDKSDNVYLCYCNKVTRAAIKEAYLKVGADIKKILAQTGACGGGRCRTENPLGRCCHMTIKHYVQELEQQRGEEGRKGKCNI